MKRIMCFVFPVVCLFSLTACAGHKVDTEVTSMEAGERQMK